MHAIKEIGGLMGLS